MITREDEDLLLIDLSARLKYGVKVCIKLPNHREKVYEDHVGDLKEITKTGGYLVNSKGIDYRSLSLDINPYLRPLSSMTEEEEKEYNMALTPLGDFMFEQQEEFKPIQLYKNIPLELYDFFNSHHFDYRGLIEKGLALEAPKDMYITMTQEEKDNPEKKLFAKKGEWFECIQVPKTHMQYKFNKHVQYCSNEDNCICDNSGENVYIPTYIKDFDSCFVKITLTK